MRSILEPKKPETCYLCGADRYLQEHHIFGGPNRKLSEKYGLKVHLCLECHLDAKAGVHFNREKREKLQKIGQQAFEKTHTRSEFVDIFGKNYL